MLERSYAEFHDPQQAAFRRCPRCGGEIYNDLDEICDACQKEERI